MIRKRMLCFLAATIIAGAVSAQAEDVGSVTIPASVKTAGQAVSAGTYTVALTWEGAELVIQLKLGGKVVAVDIAVTKPTDKNYSSARIMYQSLKRDGNDDPLVGRVRCSYRRTLYFLYFEKQ